MKMIDLRSDTVTRPSDAMRRAMAAAEVGDDVLGDDPTVHALEAAAAERMGKQGALYMPSGTMANLVALLGHCQRGEEAIVGSEAHVLHHEAVGAAALGGINLRSAPNDSRGRLAADDVRALVRTVPPRTALLCLENTQNRCGGAAVPLASMRPAVEVAREAGAAVHLDGARIFNAAVALETDPAEIAAEADTVSFCFSKGLGAPVGSVLTGPAEFIDHRARAIRRQLGGGMRQSGVIAAAALYALEHNVERLPEDHERARRLARGLAELPHVLLDPADVDTNIVFFDLDGVDGAAFREGLAAEGVLCSGTGPTRLRMVTHLDVSTEDIDVAIAVAARVLRAL